MTFRQDGGPRGVLVHLSEAANEMSVFASSTGGRSSERRLHSEPALSVGDETYERFAHVTGLSSTVTFKRPLKACHGRMQEGEP